MIGYFFWNPSCVAFTLPFVNVPIRWYSLFFALGIYGAWVITRTLIARRASFYPEPYQQSVIDNFVEKLALYSFFGILLGARIGHVLFYDALFYFENPTEVVKIWHGGLSSHGAVIGLLIAIWLFSRKKWPEPYLPRKEELLDILSISSAFTAGCIRIGNFFNQEIIGIPSTLPWAIVFGSSQECAGAIPRHPVQLYEALVSFALLGILLTCERKRYIRKSGMITGIYLIATFSSRIVLETLKVPQCAFDESGIHMGQLLSLPFIAIGVLLLLRPYVKKAKEQTSHHSEKR